MLIFHNMAGFPDHITYMFKDIMYFLKSYNRYLGQMLYWFDQNYSKEFKHFILVYSGWRVLDLKLKCTKINVSHVLICN